MSVRLRYRELQTERLRLRRPCAGDAALVYEAFGRDPEVTRFLAWKPHTSVADAERALEARLDRLAREIEYSWMIETREAVALAGIVSAWIEDDAAELGFVLARSHWGRGLATEAVRAVVAFAEEHPELARIWATCDAENVASARVLGKSGLADRGVFHRRIVRPNLGDTPRPSRLFCRDAPTGPTR